MGEIINFFKTLIDILVAVIRFVVQLVADLGNVVQLLTQTVANLPMVLGFFPASCIGLLLAIFSVVIIYKVLGREG